MTNFRRMNAKLLVHSLETDYYLDFEYAQISNLNCNNYKSHLIFEDWFVQLQTFNFKGVYTVPPEYDESL